MTEPTLTASRRKRKGARNGSRTERLAAVHLRGDRLFLVLAVPEGDGIRITETHAFKRAEADQAARLISRQKVDRLIGVVPSAQSIVRIAAAPATSGLDEQALAGALELLAEAEVGPICPPHRRGAGVVTPGGPETKPVALAQAWAPSAEGELAGHIEPHIWITAPAALACLAQALGGATLATDADPETGAASIIATDNTRTVARVTRLANSDPQTWQTELTHACEEIIGSDGIADVVESGTGLWPTTDAAGAASAPKPRAGIKGIPPGADAAAAWLRDYGLCAGALAAAASPDPALRALAGLHRRPPQQEMPAVMRLAAWLSEPRRAAVVVAACLLAALLLPAGAAYGRWWMLTQQVGGRAALVRQLEEARDADEFHKLLRDERWPMTKLLADVASSAPEGVQLDVLDLSRSGGLSVRGTAESTGLITQFRENLARTRVFSAIEVPTRAESAADVEFQLNARVESPHFAQVVIDDFGTRTLFHRIYGEDAVPSDGPPRTVGADEQSPRAGAGRTARSSRADTEEPDTPRGASRRDAPTAAPIPPELSDEQLAAMNSTAAREAMTQRTTALKRSDLDEATRARLQDEQARARARMLQAFNEERE